MRKTRLLRIDRGKNKEKYYCDNVEKQKKWEHGKIFQKTLLEIFNSLVRNDKNKFGYILETGQLDLKNVINIVDRESTIIVCLTHGNLTKDDIVKSCRKYDTPLDWSFEESDEDLYIHAETWEKLNKRLISQCKKYNIPYYDTSKNRKESLNNILDDIKKILNK